MRRTMLNAIRITYEVRKSRFFLWKDHARPATKFLAICSGLVVIIALILLLLL